MLELDAPLKTIPLFPHELTSAEHCLLTKEQGGIYDLIELPSAYDKLIQESGQAYVALHPLKPLFENDYSSNDLARTFYREFLSRPLDMHHAYQLSKGLTINNLGLDDEGRNFIQLHTFIQVRHQQWRHVSILRTARGFMQIRYVEIHSNQKEWNNCAAYIALPSDPPVKKGGALFDQSKYNLWNLF